MILTIFCLLFSALPPVNPQVPLVVYAPTDISATSNTLISDTITLAAPQAIGYSSWVGNFRVSVAVLSVIAPGGGDTNGTGGGGQFPAAGSNGWFVIKQ